MEKINYKSTVIACFIGYIVQAIAINFAPLLFLTFNSSYGIPMEKITALITITFVTQFLTDLSSAFFIDKIGYRASAVAAQLLTAAGLIMLAVLPDLMSDHYVGLALSVFVYAVGGGLTEVLVSPIVEACPTKNKETSMSLLHSFFCWGHVGVVLISTLYFVLFGIENWKYLALFWALIPLANTFLFAKVPIVPLVKDGEKGLTVKELASKKIFWVIALLMIVAAASEQAVAQWVSTFAESGLNVSKTVGDLAGVMTFAIAMGLARVLYGKLGNRINLEVCMLASAGLAIAAYLTIALVSVPIVGLIGCCICGFAVGLLWPGTVSLGAGALKGGGTKMFALFAFAGDFGCICGPTVAGLVTGAFDNDIRMGILTAAVFPVLTLILLAVFIKLKKREGSDLLK